jgi:putative ABC transport system permease protein
MEGGMRTGGQIETSLRDVRYGIRQLLHNPGFAIAAVLTIALGIGANTAIFSVADAVLLRHLPYPNSDRLVLVWNMLNKIGVKQLQLSAEDFDAFRTDTRTFQATVAFLQRDKVLVVGGNAEMVSVISSTPGMLSLLAGDTIAGRSLARDDWRPERLQVAVISYSLFRRRFSESRSVLGQTMRLDDQIYTIVGVLRKDFDFSIGTGSVDVWTPLPPASDHRKAQFAMLGSLNPGISLQAARQSITRLAKLLEQTKHPYQGPNGEDPGYGATVISLHDHLLGKFRTGALILLGTVALVLLIACVNVANLLIGRAAAREKEIAIRRSLGASPGRLIRQWMTESALLALLGSGIGVVASIFGIQLLKTLIPGDLPAVTGLTINATVLLFAGAISVLTCFLFGIAPAISFGDRGGSLRGSTRRRGLSKSLVSIEVALALLLTIGSGLLLRSFDHLKKIDPGFRADHLLTMRITLSGTQYKQPANRIRFFSRLQEQLRQAPGVLSASAVDRLPVFTVGVDTRGGNPFSVDGHPFDPNGAVHQIAHTQTVEGNYFRLMDIPLLAGRTFTERDRAETTPVAVINQALARSIFPNGDALQKHILLGLPAPSARWMTIVGIIGDVRTGALDLPPMPQFYTAASQDAPPRMFVVVRTLVDPLLMTHTATSIVHQLDPEQPIERVQTMETHVNETMGQPRFQASLLSFFALVALFLASVGIYGVVTHAAVQRTKELGIRMALGADRSDILRTVLFEGLKPVLLGIAAGLTGAIALTRVLTSVLYEVQPNDPFIISAAAVLLASVGSVACLVPAGRSTRVDPVTSLRYE